MNVTSDNDDAFLGLEVNGYRLNERIGNGKIGTVYKAFSNHTNLTLACKVIPEGSLKQGWPRELEKVRKLQGVPHVTQYHTHGTGVNKLDRPFIWILFDYVDGPDLRKKLRLKESRISMSFIESVVLSVLNVLHACGATNIIHGDLHCGNILIAKPDARLLDSKESIWITDFGYGGSHNDKQPKDDFQQLAQIMLELLACVRVDELNSRDKILHKLAVEFAKKRVRDGGRTVAVNPKSLVVEFDEIRRKAERESAAGEADEDVNRQPADYLWAEALGTRKQEWKNLFVPDLLASRNVNEFGDLLAKTITVLTGARGCGKTRSFRRLTKLMDVMIGEELPVSKKSNFVGFYLNCRDITDAFPWVNDRLNDKCEQQIIHFFHLAWLSEITKTIACVDPDETGSYKWLETWFITVCKQAFQPAGQGQRIISHVRAFIEDEKERCRLSPLGKVDATWDLARTDLLDNFFDAMIGNVMWLRTAAVFLFLDDYTIPILPRSVQLSLNPIIFRRRSTVFFKVSTEASNSFVPTSRNKHLELNHDFVMLDLATESLHQRDEDREKLLDLVFRPRIKRHKRFRGLDLGLEDLLGRTPYSYNELSWQMRNIANGDEPKKRVLYHGKRVFVSLWTSDIRTMVEVFNDMLREANGSLTETSWRISDSIQDRCIRNQGGEMMTFTQSIRDQDLWKQTSAKGNKDRAEKFGNHLKTIVEAFMGVSKYELQHGDLVSNQRTSNPKQAFRIEIVDSFEPDKSVRGYFEGLIRYHIFLQDWRGKSQRGMLTPRLYLNRMFLPHGGLSLSSHDHIQLKNDELTLLLEKPAEFLDYWKKKRKEQKARKANSAQSQPVLDL